MFPNKRQKGGGFGGWRELRRVEGRENIARIYFVEKKDSLKREKKKMLREEEIVFPRENYYQL